MNKMIHGLIIFIAVLTLVGLGDILPLQAKVSRSWTAMQVSPQEENKIDPALETRLASAQPGEMIPVIVTLKAKADLSRIGGPDRQARLQGVIRALQAIAEASQRDVRSLIESRVAQGLVGQVTYFWVFNGLSVTATPEVIEELAVRPDVLKITPDEIAVEPEAGLAVSAPQQNLSIVNAPALWDLGFYGQGIVVASMDTGVDVNHPELSMRWRGGSNSWFDPYGQHPDMPVDLSGHGTQSMGVIVGGDASGTSIGLAPQAQWIAVKIFDDNGTATATAIHQGFQWLLNPDGDINTADAPHVVNNSWTFAYPGCDLEFEQDLLALQAAGILPVFAAGNGGPNAATSYSPANNPSALAVGGTDDGDNIYLYSSRGPSSCGETETIYPELVAPGVGIYTTDRYGQYTSMTGTSSAAPHVTGGLALLLTSFPNLSAYEQSAALVNSAFDLGLNGPDNTFGYGRLDLLAAYQLIQSGALPTPTPDSSLNLAVNKLVDVSSYQDTAHTGAQAVDGDLATYWQSKKAVGKKASNSEWIKVDLGSQATLNKVVLEWDAYYASTYNLQVSADDQVWNTVFSTISGDGGNDTLFLNMVSARYVMVESTVWSDSSLRTWLKEFQVYGSAGDPSPTHTPTPTTPTPTPEITPTPTEPPPTGTSLHVGDLDGSSNLASKNRWDAGVFITIHDATEMAFSNAIVSGVWSGGASENGACVTDMDGQCSLILKDLKSNVNSVTFTITDISAASAQYEAASNHDPDGDSDGTGITMVQP